VTPVNGGGALWPFPIRGSGRFLYYNNASRRIELASLTGSGSPTRLFPAETSLWTPEVYGWFWASSRN